MLIPYNLVSASAKALSKNIYSDVYHPGLSGSFVPSNPVSGKLTSLNGAQAVNNIGQTANNLTGSSFGSILKERNPSITPGLADKLFGSSTIPLLKARGTSNPSVPSKSMTPSFSPVHTPGDGGVSVAVPDYLYADLAKAYGMDATTAYQEALSNTSYRRAMADLKAAGLNPILVANGFSGASGVSYARPLAQSDTVATVSGSSGRLNTGTTSGKSLHNWYKTLTNIGTVVGASFGHPIIGSSVGSAIGNLMDMISDSD